MFGDIRDTGDIAVGGKWCFCNVVYIEMFRETHSNINYLSAGGMQ